MLPRVSYRLSNAAISSRVRLVAMLPSQQLAAQQATRVAQTLTDQDTADDAWSISVQSLTPEHQTVKLLSNSNGIAGVRFLHELMRIKREIEQRHDQMRASIAEILSGDT